MAGLSTTGLTIKTLLEILEEIGDDQKADAALGSEWDTSTTSPQGVLNGIVAERIAEAWQVLSAVYNQAYPDGAEGVQLDRIAEYTGAVRLAAESSTVDVVCYGTNNTDLAAGRVLSVGGEQRFASTVDATIVTVDDWTISTVYAEFDLVLNDTGKLYVCTAEGTSAGSGGPTGTSVGIADGSVTWAYVVTASAAVVVPFESEDTGEIVANAGTLTQIETSVGGWDGATNPLDAESGRDEETDTDFRGRRAALLRIQGSGTLDAIRSDLLDVEDVTSCIVFENATDSTDGDGLPPHSIEVLVQNGEDQDIFDAILATKPAGIATYGTETGTVTDASGIDHTVYFTRATDVDIYITVDVTVLSLDWPEDGEEQIKDALVAYGDALEIGDDVVRSQLFAPADSVSGVYDVTAVKLGVTASPVGTSNLTIDSRERAVFDTSRIVVNVTEI